MEIKPYSESEIYKAEQAKLKTEPDPKLKIAIEALQDIQYFIGPLSNPKSVAGKIYDITVLALARLRGRDDK